MKIRSVTLTNFRKFVGAVRVEEIGDGVSVLVGRNELGKSTILEAINGVIFEKAKSTAQSVKSFRHFTNGTVPEVELRFELGGENWTLHKRFAGQGGKATFTSGTRRFEDEAAEAELQRLLGFTGGGRGASEPGIWGTLWVRQGNSFGPFDLGESARRTLQSCLESQVGAVTGGVRGQKIPTAVETALNDITSSRGPRGRYKEVSDQLGPMNAKIDELKAKRADLFKQMDALSQARKELRNEQADWDEHAHRQELADTRNKATAAATAVAEIANARSTAKLTEERLQAAQTDIEERERLTTEIANAIAALSAIDSTVVTAQEAKEKAQSDLDANDQTLGQLRDKLQLSGERGRHLERIRTAIALKSEIDRFTTTIARASSLEAEVTRLSEAIGRFSVTPELVQQIEAATSGVAAANAAINAVATTITFEIEPEAKIKVDRTPLDLSTTKRSIVSKAIIDIDGVGTIAVEPQIQNRDTIQKRAATAEQALRDALSAAAVDDLATARTHAAQRQELQRQLTDAQREIAGLAPGDKATQLAPGLDALRNRLADRRGRLESEMTSAGLVELPAVDSVEKEISEIRDDIEATNGQIKLADTNATSLQLILTQTASTLGKREQERAALDGKRANIEATLKATRARVDDEALAVQVTNLKQDLAKKLVDITRMEANSGEPIEAINAKIKRLEGAGQSHQQEINRLNTEITRLSTQIEANEGAGIEEALEAAIADQGRLDAEVKNYAQDASVLRLLLDTLRGAESEAKTLYLAPVASRVEPYLKMLLPDANVVLDENLGITALNRDGADEGFEHLSGGTQEQIAVLTRLAFAELLMKQGKPATVILDDALAFSDDDRIERMFDVLLRAGEHVQIIVLTCRKRLFTRLGASTLQIIESASAR